MIWPAPLNVSRRTCRVTSVSVAVLIHARVTPESIMADQQAASTLTLLGTGHMYMLKDAVIIVNKQGLSTSN